jgi:sarcosine oxidase delta subunit
MREGQLLVECPRCMERKVAEWDLAWKPERNRPDGKNRRAPRLWRGALAKSV